WGSSPVACSATGARSSTGSTRRCSAVCSISTDWPRSWARRPACRRSAGSLADVFFGLARPILVDLLTTDGRPALAAEVRARLGRAEERPLAHGPADARPGDRLHVREVFERFVDLLDHAAEAGALVILVSGADDPHHLVPRRGRAHPFPALAEVVLDLAERTVAEPAS